MQIRFGKIRGYGHPYQTHLEQRPAQPRAVPHRGGIHRDDHGVHPGVSLISSLFEQLAGLKAGTWYAGADLYVSALTTHAEEVADYAAALTAVFILLWALSHATSFFQVSSPRYRTRDDRSLRAN